MAEIKIEKKNNNNIWLWVIALLLIGGVIWWIAADDKKPLTAYDAPEVGQTEELGAAEETGIIEEQRVSDEYLASEEEVNTAAVVRDYVEFVEDRFEGADFNLNHSYSSEAILKLQNALAVLAREKTDIGIDIRDEMETLETYAKEIQTDPEALRHAELIQLAAIKSAKIMQTFQEEETEYVTSVMEEADDINGKVPAMEQKPAIKEFFVAAKEAVERLSKEVGVEEGEGIGTEEGVGAGAEEEAL